MGTPAKPSLRRRLRAGWRDTLLLLDEFKFSLLAFAALIVLGALIWSWVPKPPDEEHSNFGETLYRMTQLVFFQGGDRFPQTGGLRVFYFVMPLLGLGVLGFGLADFGVQFFNRRSRSKEWEMAIASTLKSHTVLVGLGHLGYRIANRLRDMGREIVVIEREPKEDLVAAIRQRDVAVIMDDGSRDSVLEGAGIRRARAIVLAVQDDALNLKIALKARALNPSVEVIVRIFDDDFAEALRAQFGFTAMSATSLAAPFFAASAAGLDANQPLTLGGQTLGLTQLEITAGSALAGRSVGDLEQAYNLSMVMVRRAGTTDMHPADGVTVAVGDAIAVFGSPESIQGLVDANRGR